MAKIRAIRDAFAEALLELGQVNKKVVVLDADLAHCSRTRGLPKNSPSVSSMSELPSKIW